jgi:hypothetical protein
MSTIMNLTGSVVLLDATFSAGGDGRAGAESAEKGSKYRVVSGDLLRQIGGRREHGPEGSLLETCSRTTAVRRGERALREHASGETASGTSFPPPWAWPHSVPWTGFDPVENEKFMHHDGEEILL